MVFILQRIRGFDALGKSRIAAERLQIIPRTAIFPKFRLIPGAMSIFTLHLAAKLLLEILELRGGWHGRRRRL